MILGKYNQAKTVYFDLFQVDGIDFEPAATFATGDIKIMKDEGVEANTTNLPTDEGQGYSLILTATEMSAARIKLYIVDQTGTKVWLDTSVHIETYGNASAEHAFDLDTASVAQTADHTAGIADIPTVAEFNARTLVAASYFDPAADTVTLAGTQGAITWGAQTISVTGATDNITLAGSGSGDCLTFTRSGSGNLFDTNWSADLRAEVATELATYDGPTNAEFEARTPTAAQLAYITANANTGLPVTFTTSGGSTTAAVIALVDGSAGSATDDQYNGRLLVFTDGTLKGVVTDITDYVGGTTTATITAIPTAPTASHNARLI